LGSTETRFRAIFPNPGGLFITGARSFVRIAFAGFFVSSLIVACTVKEGSSEPTASCHPGDHKDCTCSSGKPGQRDCNDSGDGYGTCVCDGSVEAGGNATTGGNAGAGPVSTGGTKSYAGSAGTTNGGGIGYACEAAGGASGGAGEVGGASGAGGAGDVTPLECQDTSNDCETCYFGGCCDQYAPCVNDPDGNCLRELAEVLTCTDAIKETRDVKTADLEQCAQDAGQTSGSWSASLSPLTVDVINCIAGEPGWEGSPWGPLACKASCFDK